MTEQTVLWLRRDLGEPFDAPAWPAGICLAAFMPERAAEVHALLVLAYANGAGTVAELSAWWPTLSADAEFDPALCFLAQDAQSRVVGVAQCWTGAFVKDLAVHPQWRRRGLGRALMLHTFGIFKQRGAAAVDLKAKAGNPSGAVDLYRSVGMREVAA